MKISSIVNFNIFNQHQNRKKRSSFKGTPVRAFCPEITCAADALMQWERIMKPKYFDVHSDKILPNNKRIRLANYSFLDKLTSSYDKQIFVNHFCDFTAFPNLKVTSEKIVEYFKDTVFNICNQMKRNMLDPDDVDFRAYGYDPSCSIGLKHAFPGADLDKGFIVLRGTGSLERDKSIVSEFSAKLWEKLDQRLVTLNSPDTYPTIITEGQILDKLERFEPYANDVLNPTGIKLFTLGRYNKYYDLKYDTFHPVTDPYIAGQFNREIAKRLPENLREEAKNFAFFSETFQAMALYGNCGRYYNMSNKTMRELYASEFYKFSNTAQIPAWHWKTNFNIKTKLKNRETLADEFPRMAIDEKYELVKDVIKSASGDQSEKFSKYFKNDDNIKDRFSPLLESLK